MLRIVETPKFPPARCAITGITQGPFLDTGVTLPNARPHIYVSTPGAVKVGRAVGMLDPEDAKALVAERDALLIAVEDLKAQVAESETLRANVEYTLKQFGLTIHARPGPKPKAKGASS